MQENDLFWAWLEQTNYEKVFFIISEKKNECRACTTWIHDIEKFLLLWLDIIMVLQLCFIKVPSKLI